MTSVAIVTPSRGLVHSRTIAAVMGNIAEAAKAGHPITGWTLTHDKPIPDCDEACAEAGMASGADAIWFVEEDVIAPPGALLASLALLPLYDVVAVDYPVGSDEQAWGCSVSGDDGEVLWCGLGATLVARRVFAHLPRPWFRTDVTYARRGGGAWLPEPSRQVPEKRWGQQDIYFAMALRAAGMRIGLVPGMTAAQARVKELGKPGTNHGWHTIAIQSEIKRQYPG